MTQTLELKSRLEVDRRHRKDRRKINDRRVSAASHYDGAEQRQEDRRKVERRRMVDPTTCERDYSADEVDFMRAMDEYKRKSGRQFPTWSEVLEVLHSIGYRRVSEPTELIYK